MLVCASTLIPASLPILKRPKLIKTTVIAGFFTGGSLAIRGGRRAALTSGIGCAVLLGVIEGVGIGFQRMMAGNTALAPPMPPAPVPGQVAAVA